MIATDEIGTPCKRDTRSIFCTIFQPTQAQDVEKAP
jgi:hypothetical protein